MKKRTIKTHKSTCNCAACKSVRGEYNGINNPNYKQGSGDLVVCKISHCINLVRKFSKTGLCIKCYNHDPIINAQKSFKMKNTPRPDMIGKNNPRYIDGRTNKQYYCEECNKLVSDKGRKCPSCAQKKVEHLFNRHHIDLCESNNLKDNILILTVGKHRSLHLNAYHYLTTRGLICDYVDWFFLHFNRLKRKDEQTDKHHIDMDKTNNISENLLYLPHGLHSLLHKTAYSYTLINNEIFNYTKWYDKTLGLYK